MKTPPNRSLLCSLEFAPGDYCRQRRKSGSEFCHAHQEASARTPISTEALQAQFLQRAEESPYLAHSRTVCRLVKAGAKILAVGNRGYPDILFEMGNRVFAIEVKDKYERLGNRQRLVLDALRRLERIDVIRESGEKRTGELSLDELLDSIKTTLS